MMAAIPRQIRACEASGKKDDPHRNKKLHPIFGIELYVNPLQIEYSRDVELQAYLKTLNPAELKVMRHRGYHLLAIAYNQTGYSNLVQLSSLAWMKGYYYRPRVNHEQLVRYKEGIIFTSCCYASEVGRAFDTGGEDAGNAMIEKYLAMFGREHYYLEIMLLDFSKQKPYDVFIIKAAEKYNLKLILTQDCLVENTLVLTDKGHRFIQDIVPGEQVWTHNNRFRSVEMVNRRGLSKGEKVYRVKSALGTLSWELTGNHQVRLAEVVSINNKKIIKSLSWKCVEDLRAGNYIVIPKIKADEIFAKKPLGAIDLADIIDDYGTDSGKVGHGAATRLCLNDGNFVTYHRFDRRNKITIPRQLPVTKDLLSVLGLYIAEGGLDRNSNKITFGLHIRETNEVELVTRYFHQFGIKITKKYKVNSCELAFQSVVFRRFFEKVCGRGSKHKTLPVIQGNVFGVFSKEQILHVLGQYWLGDGSSPKIHERAGAVISVSKKLIYDIATVLNALGILVIPSVRKHEKTRHKNPKANPKRWNDAYYLSFGGNSRVRFENLLFGRNVPEKPNNENRGRRFVEGSDCYAVRINDIIEIDYQKEVFNLQVAEDESYVANLHVLHNCHYCNAEDSKYQRLMLMVQTKNTIQEIQRKIAEEGMQDFFELQDSNLWMKTEDELNWKWQNDYSDVIDYEIFKQAKRNTVAICEKAKGVELDRGLKMPKIPDADDKLKEAFLFGFKSRGLPTQRVYLDRLKEEYSLICHKGFSSYFLIQKQMTDEARRISRELLGWGDGSEAVGPCRGSAGGSLICYCLGITDVDPIPHDLLFSRFLSQARGGKTLNLRFQNIEPMA